MVLAIRLKNPLPQARRRHELLARCHVSLGDVVHLCLATLYLGSTFVGCRGDKRNLEQRRDASTGMLAASVRASAGAMTAPPNEHHATATSRGIGGATMAKRAPHRRLVVDFATCHAEKHGKGAAEEGDDDAIRCPLSSGLVAQQDGSACFDVNRLLDARGESLFTSEMLTPKGTVFAVARKFEIYQCGEQPVAVLQSGELFSENISAANPCHGAKALRAAHLVQDVRGNRRYDDVSLKRAKELIARIVQDSPCGGTASSGTAVHGT